MGEFLPQRVLETSKDPVRWTHYPSTGGQGGLDQLESEEPRVLEGGS